MEVNKFTVYRIVPFESPVNIGDSVIPSKCKIKGERKERIEEALEENRPALYPQRDNCLYVCFSKENAYEWANIKYGRRNTTYKLLTLEVTGELYWFMSDCYNLLMESFAQNKLNEVCVNYWESIIENVSALKLDKGYEGLFVDKAVVKTIEYKNYINGESVDVE